MSINDIAILAVISAVGVIENATQSIFTAVLACSEVKDAVCLPRP